MKRKKELILLFVFVTILGITHAFMKYGSTKEISDIMNEPISFSGSVEDYTNLETEEREEICIRKHIEVYGIVSKDGFTLFYLGNKSNGEIEIVCTFAGETDELAKVVEGDFIKLNGVCDSVSSKVIFLDGCILTEHSKIK